METAEACVERKKLGDVKVWSGLSGMAPDSQLTVRGLADALGVVGRTVRRMLDRCELPEPIRVGKKRFWKVSRLTAWFDRMAEQGEKKTECRRKKIAELA